MLTNQYRVNIERNIKSKYFFSAKQVSSVALFNAQTSQSSNSTVVTSQPFLDNATNCSNSSNSTDKNQHLFESSNAKKSKLSTETVPFVFNNILQATSCTTTKASSNSTVSCLDSHDTVLKRTKCEVLEESKPSTFGLSNDHQIENATTPTSSAKMSFISPKYAIKSEEYTQYFKASQRLKGKNFLIYL